MGDMMNNLPFDWKTFFLTGLVGVPLIFVGLFQNLLCVAVGIYWWKCLYEDNRYYPPAVPLKDTNTSL